MKAFAYLNCFASFDNWQGCCAAGHALYVDAAHAAGRHARAPARFAIDWTSFRMSTLLSVGPHVSDCALSLQVTTGKRSRQGRGHQARIYSGTTQETPPSYLLQGKGEVRASCAQRRAGGGARPGGPAAAGSSAARCKRRPTGAATRWDFLLL